MALCHAQDTQQNGSAVAGETTPLLKLEEFLPYRLAVLSTVLWRGVAQLHEGHGLNSGEWIVLMALGEAGAATSKALGSRNRMHKTKVSRAVNGLLLRGLILRQANRSDLREAILQLSPAGKSMYEQCVPHALAYLKQLEEGLTEQERAALDRGLARLALEARRLIADPFDVGTRPR
jgi:DNA-binding MarR family transcriptional regulator